MFVFVVHMFALQAVDRGSMILRFHSSFQRKLLPFQLAAEFSVPVASLSQLDTIIPDDGKHLSCLMTKRSPRKVVARRYRSAKKSFVALSAAVSLFLLPGST